MADDFAIKIDHVSKAFRLPHEKSNSLKSALINFHKRGYERQEVLKDVNFEIKKGEFFGIVGRNGSGKSTLLKLLAGIYIPDKGQIHVRGKLTPFIELGVGFNPELTGRENVYLNGALLGFNRSEMAAMYDDIVAFAELERFMDQKLKNYSSGMQVRLAFSIAVKSNSEILLFDEVLAVGDERFQKKCIDVFRSLKKQKRTIILVTHDMGNVERFCDRALVMEPNHKITITTPAEASMIYSRMNIDEDALAKQDELQRDMFKRRGNGKVKVAEHRLLHGGKESSVFSTGEEVVIEMELERKPESANLPVVCGLSFHSAEDAVIAGPNSLQATLRPDAKLVHYLLPKLPLAPGDYRLTIALYDENQEALDVLEKWIHFSVVSDHLVPGYVEFAGEWSSK